MIALENLVIGVTNYFQFFINKSFVYGSSDGYERNLLFQILENGIESFQLFRIFRKKMDRKMFGLPGFQVLDQQVKLPVKCRLFLCVENDFQLSICGLSVSKMDGVPLYQ